MIAFAESQDPAGAYAKMTAVPDAHVKTAGDLIYVPGFANHLIGAMACIGTTGDRARINSPSLLRTNRVYITPIELDIHPGANFKGMFDPNLDIILDIDEGIDVENNSNPAAAEQQAVALWLADRKIEPVSGKIHTINCSLTVAQTAGTWAFSEITLVDELPVGNYDVVGMRVVADGGVAARLVFVGGHNRPGVPCMSDVEMDTRNLFRFGNAGVFGSFHTSTLPGIELLGSAAVGSATYQMFLDVIRK